MEWMETTVHVPTSPRQKSDNRTLRYPDEDGPRFNSKKLNPLSRPVEPCDLFGEIVPPCSTGLMPRFPSCDGV